MDIDDLIRDDGYINVTKMFKATNSASKRFNHWLICKRTNEFIKKISEIHGLPEKELIEKGKGGKNKSQTWVHPLIATDIAQWISDTENL